MPLLDKFLYITGHIYITNEPKQKRNYKTVKNKQACTRSFGSVLALAPLGLAFGEKPLSKECNNNVARYNCSVNFP